MAELTIRLRFNRHTGRRELVLIYESDDDVLAHEHERDHRALVESLIGRPIEGDTDVIVERARKDGAPLDAPQEALPPVPVKTPQG